MSTRSYIAIENPKTKEIYTPNTDKTSTMSNKKTPAKGGDNIES